MAKTIKDVLSVIQKAGGFGALDQAAINNMKGINHRGYGNPLPVNKDNFGLTFFTRPNLNLSYDNIAQRRILTPLLDGDGLASNTYQRAIRMTLDPYLGDPAMYKTGDPNRALKMLTTDLIDQKNAFIPLLTNNLISISGWPDLQVETFTSTPGNYQESWSMVDSSSRFFGTYEIQANFKNIEGDPISAMFSAWLHYMSGVYEGSMVPYPNNLVERRIDYQTRIYRLLLDPSRRYVQKIAACGAAFPLNSPLGNSFNYSNEGVYNQDNDQISIRFRAMGADYLDPITIQEFNAVVQIFNPQMKGDDNDRSKTYRKAAYEELKSYNYQGYPRIDPDSHELQWWIDKNQGDQSSAAVKSASTGIDFSELTSLLKGTTT